MNQRIYFILIFLGIIISSCKEEIQKVADVFVQPTAREVYERKFEKDDFELLNWKNAFDTAKKDSIQITLPYSESGVFSEDGFYVYSYNVQLKEGEKIIIEVEKQIDTAAVFIDLFQKQNDSLKIFEHLKSSEDKQSNLSQEIEISGYYKVIVQPQMQLQFPFILKIYTEPLYEFPVSGGGNKNIQSFWADPRDDGGRSHEGVDIFAARGTPVVAVTKGIISSTGDRGLGGKQVWLHDGLFGKTIYFAHLDSIATNSGKKVKPGDTLGFVGNTGNAKTTAPHLHFGIYTRRYGAIDPFPFIRNTEIQEVKNQNLIYQGVISKNRSELRKGPATGYPEFKKLSKNDTVTILGKNSSWFHIHTRDSVKGFVHESSIKELSSN